MIKSFEAKKEKRALATIPDNDVSYRKDNVYEIMLMSESSLSKDWLKPEEDAAWKDL